MKDRERGREHNLTGSPWPVAAELDECLVLLIQCCPWGPITSLDFLQHAPNALLKRLSPASSTDPSQQPWPLQCFLHTLTSHPPISTLGFPFCLPVPHLYGSCLHRSWRVWMVPRLPQCKWSLSTFLIVHASHWEVTLLPCCGSSLPDQYHLTSSCCQELCRQPHFGAENMLSFTLSCWQFPSGAPKFRLLALVLPFLCCR